MHEIKIAIVPVTVFRQNCALLWDENRRALVVDPGGEPGRVLDAVDNLR
ncbi:MAG: MBL fold metallo-hydrolase, partial [Acidisphaera sp.]|nr:MBL fold metallo-hydrolase [Acidisphaera sp.]